MIQQIANLTSLKQTPHAPQHKPLCKLMTYRCKPESLLEQLSLIWLFPDKARQPGYSNYKAPNAAAEPFKIPLSQVHF